MAGKSTKATDAAEKLAQEEGILKLDVRNDPAAQSIMYLYLQARGVESANPADPDEVLKIAQVLADSPDNSVRTAVQALSQTESFLHTLAAARDGAPEECTLEELRIAIASFGYSIAGVLLREMPDREFREEYEVEFRALVEAASRT